MITVSQKEWFFNYSQYYEEIAIPARLDDMSFYSSQIHYYNILSYNPVHHKSVSEKPSR